MGGGGDGDLLAGDSDLGAGEKNRYVLVLFVKYSSVLDYQFQS